MKSKKGAVVFSPVIIIITVIILLIAWSTLIAKYGKFEKNIGKRQYDLINTYQESEKALFYIDQSAKYSLQQAVYDLANNGGISEVDVDEESPEEESNKPVSDNICRKFYGYSMWYNLAKDAQGSDALNTCIDNNKITFSLLYIFNKNLNEYLLEYPNNIPLDNYEYEINKQNGNLEIIGKAIEPIKFDIVKDESKKIRKEPSEAKIETSGRLINSEEFTGMDLCAKGTICFLTDSAFKKMQEAEAIAAEKGVHLKVNSAYRDKKKQTYLWEVTYGKIPENERRAFVCYPYGDNVETRCPHLTGNAVDVTFLGKTTKTMSWEDWVLLKEIMIKAGWVKYKKEPWHFECCGTNRYELAKKQGLTEIG